MTVETQTGGGEPITKSGPYSGNGVTAVFNYDFQIQDQTELLVTRQNADMTETVLVLTTDYTVSGVGNDAGGSITLVDPATDAPSGTQIVIQYDGDFNQETDYSNQGSIQLGLLEDALDKLTMHLRALKEIVDRAVTVDTFGTTDVATLRTNIAALAAIESQITAVAGIVSEITTVAGDSAEIVIVAGDSAEINALAALTTEIAVLDAISADITTVAGISSEVGTVANIAADITALVAGVGGTLTGAWTASGLWDFTNTGYIGIPRGTTAQRGTPASSLRALRYNNTTGEFEGWNGSTWGSIGGAGRFRGENGVTGSSTGAGDIFRVHEQELNTDTTIAATENALAAGPLTIASGTTLTIASGGNLAIV